MLDTIPLGFGYSPEHDCDTTAYRELLEFLFGEFTTIRFHVEELAPDVRRVSVVGVNTRTPRTKYIDNTFCGVDGRLHQTTTGAMLWIKFSTDNALTKIERVVMRSFSEVDSPNLAAAE